MWPERAKNKSKPGVLSQCHMDLLKWPTCFDQVAYLLSQCDNPPGLNVAQPNLLNWAANFLFTEGMTRFMIASRSACMSMVVDDRNKGISNQSPFLWEIGETGFLVVEDRLCCSHWKKVSVFPEGATPSPSSFIFPGQLLGVYWFGSKTCGEIVYLIREAGRFCFIWKGFAFEIFFFLCHEQKLM